jgi:cation diffusion facilitator CzcD-associated flavoprotein CzcO
VAELPTVCVIGAGISGLTATKALGDWGVPHQTYEASDEVGGNWYFRNPNGRSSAYESLHIDTSKERISFEDFPMPGHYPDFPHHAEIHAWLCDYADAFGLRERIAFETRVERAERLPRGGWRIALEGGETREFDALVVANGHHWDPRWPDFPGTFDGEQLHSHHYIGPTDPLDLQGKRVVVVGIGNSAVDIASELSRKGVASKVFLSTRSGAWVLPKYILGRPADQILKPIPQLPLGPQRRMGALIQRLASGRMEDFGLPTPDHRFGEAHPTQSSELLLRLGSGDAVAKPNVAALEGTRVRFEDGSVEEVDAIVYATGYRINFPFFDEDFISAPGNRLSLYKRIFKPGIDDLAFVGLAQAIPTLFPFVELQSRLVARWLAGDWALPAPDEMERAIEVDEQRYTRRFSSRPRHTMQADWYIYSRDLRRKEIPAGRKRAREGMAPHLAGRAAAVEHAGA